MGRMASVRRKLREAFFFYKKLSEQYLVHPESEESEFYLSAFLSAGRSVTGFFDERENRSWFDDWKTRLTSEDREFLKYMLRQRNLEVHEEGPDVLPEVQPVAANETLLTVKKYHFWRDGERSDIDDTCMRYLELLLRLLTHFDDHLSEVTQRLWGSFLPPS